jgi:hypothetical protein
MVKTIDIPGIWMTNEITWWVIINGGHRNKINKCRESLEPYSG